MLPEGRQPNDDMREARESATPDRLRMIDLSPGDVWPERHGCELVLVLDCRAKGFALDGLDGLLCAGETALLPSGNGLSVSSKGRVLCVTMARLDPPEAPQRLRDGLIALLIRRVWASSYTAQEIVTPAFDLIDALATNSRSRNHKRLDAFDRLDPRTARVLDFIDAHVGEDLNTAQLAEVANLSAGHFSRNFKAQMGEPVWTFVMRRRCERAKDLLMTTDLSIAEISYACGFAHQGHLARCFKKQFNMTPGEARAER